MIVDTMVAAYACFNVPDRSASCRKALRKARSLWAPDSFRAEFINVAWQYARAYSIPPHDLESMTHDGLAIPSAYMDSSILWRDALALALEADHSPYDTLFVAAARKRKTRVLTYDRKLLAAFPALTLHVEQYA